MSDDIAPTYRWRRRRVTRVRVTWLGMVAVLCLLTHRSLLEHTTMGMSLQVLSFIGVVILPMIALVLWRLGLLPPERVLVGSAIDPPAQP